jgi:mRNA interferase MazF
VLVVSHDVFNRGPAELVVVLPLTSRLRKIRSHIRVDPPEGGLRSPSAVMCEAIRSVSKERLSKRFGRLDEGTMDDVDDVLAILLDL